MTHGRETVNVLLQTCAWCCCGNNKIAFIETICVLDMIWVQDGCYSTFAFVDFFFQSGCQASVLLHHLVRSLVPIIICILYL